MSIPIQIATRKSKLALWQAETIQSLLLKQGLVSELLPLVTTGDKMQKIPLADIHLENDMSDAHHLTTGKGLFIKEIQDALLSRKAHIAVHSMKDLPVTQTNGLKIMTLLPRAGARDVLILSSKLIKEIKEKFIFEKEIHNLSFEELKKILLQSKIFNQEAIGTTSTRRQMLLKKVFGSHLNIEILRGNVDTRLKRVRNDEFSAIILAEAGLERLRLFHNKEMFYLPVHEFIPATAQGVIAVEVMQQQETWHSSLHNLNCPKACVAAGIERMILALLGGDCHSSIGVHFIDKQIYVICGRNHVHKETVFTISAEEFLQIEKLWESCLFNYSQYFEKLCQSSLCESVKMRLIAAGFLEVSALNFNS
ncbi:hydroxymethylbilane synthase [Silvanigrella aquatica]|uniref:hydroxymethylbilane synthase n=1 Tax=Silvanigrella aquatica TaxID=1915309 RepID=A0A1L4D1F6_9BACT|nr:hydroxymethylbilane synthase [Silvanigrella aquatica]APJ04032.1 hypothetical protein AXG55_08975 [Silvanigrella aquatica]